MTRFSAKRLWICLIMPLLLAGCASGSDSIHEFVSGANLLPQQPEAKDFVKAARPDIEKADYLPVGFEPKARKLPVRTPAEAAADDKALQALAAHAGNTPKSDAPNASRPKKKPVLEPDADAKPALN